jgi:hypothetical protein
LDPFRKVPKRRTHLLLPVELDDRVRAVRGRQSLSSIIALAICEHLKMDPAAYGLGDPPVGGAASDATPVAPVGPPGSDQRPRPDPGFLPRRSGRGPRSTPRIS